MPLTSGHTEYKPSTGKLDIPTPLLCMDLRSLWRCTAEAPGAVSTSLGAALQIRDSGKEHHLCGVPAQRQHAGLHADRLELRRIEVIRRACQLLEVDIWRDIHLAGVNLQDLGARILCGVRELDLPVQPPRAHQRWVENVCPVCGCYYLQQRFGNYAISCDKADFHAPGLSRNRAAVQETPWLKRELCSGASSRCHKQQRRQPALLLPDRDAADQSKLLQHHAQLLPDTCGVTHRAARCVCASAGSLP